MTVLCWGLPGDSTMSAVRREVAALGISAAFLDQRLVSETSVELCAGSSLEAQVHFAGGDLDLTRVNAAYLRPHEGTRVAAAQGAEPGSPLWCHASAVDEALGVWSDVAAGLVITRPSVAASNGSKPAQLREIAGCGFAVPETLVTNDPALVAQMLRDHEELVYKSTSGVRSRVRRVDSRHTANLPAVMTCPTQFQARVPGTDVRVHVVGAEVFATLVVSDADDYRYATRQGLPPAQLAAIELPAAVSLRCMLLASRLELPVAGIDLRVTDDGEWFCFEVNPSPAFAYYESGTGAPIAAAVAGLLAAADVCARPA